MKWFSSINRALSFCVTFFKSINFSIPEKTPSTNQSIKNPRKTKIDFLNKTDKNIKIDWNQVLFIDTDGSSKKVFHAGVRYIERDKEQAPTIIYKGTNINDLIIPIQNVYFSSGSYGGWRTKPLINAPVVGISVYDAYDPNLVGKTMKAIIPINIEDKTFEYVYTFQVSFIPKDAKK